MVALAFLLTVAPLPWPVLSVMAATITVTTSADKVNPNGPRSLQEAIIHANDDNQNQISRWEICYVLHQGMDRGRPRRPARGSATGDRTGRGAIGRKSQDPEGGHLGGFSARPGAEKPSLLGLATLERGWVQKRGQWDKRSAFSAFRDHESTGNGGVVVSGEC